ncbi:hypothetical protein [Streptomyces sp. NPDC051636]|uniref:hypothetical protein n=1 Tax=Streptomyces sp. NPDC051636 TaxID=3365663 RepID=UPI0037A299A1
MTRVAGTAAAGTPIALRVKVADIEDVKASRAVCRRPGSAVVNAPAMKPAGRRGGGGGHTVRVAAGHQRAEDRDAQDGAGLLDSVVQGRADARLLPAARQAAAGHGHLTESCAEASAATEDPVRVRDATFAYGLDVVLDGLALRLPRQCCDPGVSDGSP